ncbi:thymic stromal cotransporter homolog [Sphaeramia orbicularis]|uniref:Solute carrier family 46 member 2 n=1 Tax=Sphaeramia orbicularis TaxID=375764 RepID=A0A672Z7E3_9TELE|nr:thymic stromal cotransporter homolog [Sphaeramia orbicularis]
MALVHMCRSFSAVFRRIEPVIVLEMLGSTLFDTALQMVVRDRCANATDPDTHTVTEESRQKAMTGFYMVYNLVVQLTPIVPALALARLGDRGWRRAPVAVPLCGYLLSRVSLLLVVVCSLPLELMYGGAVLFGLCGGFSAYWPGVMTLATLASTDTDRSTMMMRVELLYGGAGLVGSLVSGHLFLVYTSSLGHGTVLLIVSTFINLLCLLLAATLLQVKQISTVDEDESCDLIPAQTSSSAPVEAPVHINRTVVVLLFAAALLYNSAVGGAIDILGSFVLKEPLNWNAKQVGYGNAAGSGIFLTSFLGVIVLRRCVSDSGLILIGMLSFASGIYFMSFVTATYMFYLARLLTLFALIPMPTIRSLLSQQVPASSCGTTLTGLQVILWLSSLAYIPAFTYIYQSTLDWCPGFVFLLSSVITVLGMIPISVVGCMLPSRTRYEQIQGD